MMAIMPTFRRIVLPLLMVLAAAALAAQGPLGDLKWRFIGPFRGGRVLAVTGVPGEPRTSTSAA